MVLQIHDTIVLQALGLSRTGKPIPMVLQIHDTIVLQGAELDGRVKSVPFWIFGS